MSSEWEITNNKLKKVDFFIKAYKFNRQLSNNLEIKI